jgi:hypothetical protein
MGLSQEWQNNPGGIAPVFNVGFDAWNTRNNNSNNPPGVNQGWTVSKGADPGGAFTVNIAQAEQFDAANNIANNPVAKGGLEIRIIPNAALLDTLNTAVTNLGGDYKITWVQALYDNYTTAGSTVIPFYEMDTTSATNPSYTDSYAPQPGGNGFYDQPKPRYQPFGTPQAFFYADAYIGIESVSKKTLTIYDGVDYGFNNFVQAPEPGTSLLLAAGMTCIIWLGWRRAASKAAAAKNRCPTGSHFTRTSAARM